MKTDNSRRSSLDRSRDLPGLKKPRLPEDAPDRTTNGVISRVSSSNPRFRENQESDDLIRELVAEYKTALAELTFNSKPIITNLTIIAGENLHAAKGIAATICNNVLEVPSEQKLPSLYLLDSIVKNIGRDYIKHFAARLPEVFCKAYKQVDSSIHTGMRHLFGTWKGVFPPSALQIIEKELGFTPVNGSSGTAASRSDSQSQRPAHSIHVNPKYLERQHLQQTRAKEIHSDESDVATPTEDTEISAKSTVTGSTRQWTDRSGKIPNIQRPQREISTDAGYEKKGIRDIKSHQFSSVLPRQPGQGGGKTERVKEQDELEKSYYGTSGTVSESLTSRRNGFDTSFGNYKASGYGQADRQLPSVQANITNKTIRPASKNWKNSEEEEYMWDDMNSKSTEFGGTNSSIKKGWNIDNADKSAGMQRGQWIPLEGEQPDFLWDKLDTFSRLKPSRGEDRVPSFRDIDDQYVHSHGQWDAESRRNTDNSADPLFTRQTASGHQVSLMRPQNEPPLPIAGLNPKSSRFSSQPEGVAISLTSGSSTNLISPLPRPGLVSHSHPSSLGPSENQSRLRHNPPLLPQAQAKTQSQPLTHVETPPTLSQSSGTPSQRFSVDVSGQSSTSDILVAIMKSGLINIQPPLPTGPPPIQALPSSGPLVTPSSLPLQISQGNSPVLTAGVGLPPLPPGPPPSSQKSNTNSVVSNPFSSLLSSLVAKGIIASPVTEITAATSDKTPNKLPDQSTESSTSTAMELGEDLIGIDFKTDIIREFHPLVISSLFDDLKHQCDTCGLRFKIQEQLQSHTYLHSSEKFEPKWYPNKKNWVAGNIVIPSSEKSVAMVPADESQCICALCGESFEDLYSYERDEWMYKGTVYLNSPESKEQVPIVHARCLSSSSDYKNKSDRMVQP